METNLILCFVSSISDAPRITLRPKNHKVAEDAIVSFFCKATGTPQPSFQWKRNDKPINPRKKNRFSIFDMPFGSVLRIEPVKSKKDDAVFTCIADNGIKEPDQANATLTVYKLDKDGGMYIN